MGSAIIGSIIPQFDMKQIRMHLSTRKNRDCELKKLFTCMVAPWPVGINSETWRLAIFFSPL